MSNTEKQGLIDRITKEFPKSTISALGDFSTAMDYIPTGSVMLDLALGSGGFPLGRVIELYGVEGSGKTTIANSIMSIGGRKGYRSLMVDAEFAYNKEFAQKMFGYKEDMIDIVRPASGEDAIGIMEAYIDEGAANIIVLDSIATIMGEDELEKDIDDPEKIGSHARIVNRMLKRVVPACGAKDIMFVVINQLRDTIGYAPTMTGGRGLRCWKGVSVQFKPGKKIEEGGKVVGRKTEFLVSKNKFGNQFTQGTFTLRWGNEPVGIDNITDTIDLAIEGKLIKANKGWYNYNELNLRMVDLRDFFLSNPDEFDILTKEVLKGF